MERDEFVEKIAGPKSDHGQRVVEWEHAIVWALKHTQPDNPTLEFGVREGGSALLAMFYVMKEHGNRAMVTVDANPAPEILGEWADKWGVAWGHCQSSQRDFVLGVHPVDYAFINFDADHNQNTVEEDVRTMAAYLAREGVIAIDDVNEWETFPDFSDVGLDGIEFAVDEGDQLGKLRHHIIFFTKP